MSIHRNGPDSFIERMPWEILGEIFEIARAEPIIGYDFTQPETNTLFRPLKVKLPIRISHVCPRFRQIALSTPTLWAVISDWMSRSEVRTFLQRSRPAPLDVYISRDIDLYDMLRLFSTANRWKSMFILVDASEDMNPLPYQANLRVDDPRNALKVLSGTFTYTTLHFPLLETIKFCYLPPEEIGRSPEEIAPHHFYRGWNAPRLETFDAVNVFPLATCGPSLKELQVSFEEDLHYHSALHHFFSPERLGAFVVLTHLSIKFNAPYDPMDWTDNNDITNRTAQDIVTLPKLKVLQLKLHGRHRRTNDIGIQRFFHAFRAPLLEHFDLYNDNPPPDFKLIPALQSYGQCSPLLRKFSIKPHPASPILLEDILATLPSIQQLTVSARLRSPPANLPARLGIAPENMPALYSRLNTLLLDHCPDVRIRDVYYYYQAFSQFSRGFKTLAVHLDDSSPGESLQPLLDRADGLEIFEGGGNSEPFFSENEQYNSDPLEHKPDVYDDGYGNVPYPSDDDAEGVVGVA